MQRKCSSVLRAVAALCALASAFPLFVNADEPAKAAPARIAEPGVSPLNRARSSHSVSAVPQGARPGERGEEFKVPYTSTKAWIAHAATGNPRNAVASEGKAIVGSGSGREVYAYDIEDGSRRWTARSKDSGISSLVLRDNFVYFTTWSCTLEGVRVSSGNHVFVQWLASTVHCAPDANEHGVFAAYPSGGGDVVSQHSDSGAVVWKSAVSSTVVHAPVACGATVAVTGTDGSVTTLGEKGDTLWSRKLGAVAAPVATPRGLLIMTAALPSDGKVERGPAPSNNKSGKPKRSDRTTSSKRSKQSEDAGPGRGITVIGSRRLAVLDPSTRPADGEDRELTGPVPSGLDYQGVRPGVDAELVVAAHADVIRAVDLSGETRWERRLETRYSQFCEPAFGDGMVFIADDYGFVTALERATGALVWSLHFGAEKFKARPAFDSHRLVLTSDTGNVICIPTGVDGKTGTPDEQIEALSKAAEQGRGIGYPVQDVPPQTPPPEARRPSRGPENDAGPQDPPPPPPQPAPMPRGQWERTEKRKAERAKAIGQRYKERPYPG